MSLTPLGDRVIVKALEQDEVTASGIILPDTAKERPQRGKVVAVGEGRWIDGGRVSLEVAPGDEVIYSKYGGTEITEDGDELLILSESDIMAVVAPAPKKKASKKK